MHCIANFRERTMARSRLIVLAAALFLSVTAPVPAQAPARVEATYVANPRDIRGERVLQELTRHLGRRAPAVLAPGQQLSVELLSVYRAGHNSWSPGNDGVRVITDSAPARIELAFTLRDADGATLAEGARSLRSPEFFAGDSGGGGDPLRFERRLLDDWLKAEFAARR
jgi:hypothetical protein